MTSSRTTRFSSGICQPYVFCLVGSTRPATHETDEVENADHVALRTAAVRECRGIAGFRIAALRTGTVNIGVMVVRRTGP